MKINENRYKNALLGLAAGDAWGYQVEFKSYDAMPHPVPQPENIWVISDDTQMTLALEKAINALEETGNLDENHLEAMEEFIIQEFGAWAFSDLNNRAPGTTCMWSIQNLFRNENVHWSDPNGARNSAGCGAVMRLLPTIALDDNMWQAATVLQAVITHNDPQAVASALLLGEVARSIANGSGDAPLMVALDVLDEMRAKTYKWNPFLGRVLSSVTKDVNEYLRVGASKSLTIAIDRAAKRAIDSETFGYDYDICADVGEGWDAMTATALAILAANAYDIGELTAKEAMEWAVTSNGDSDSIGAIAGMLIGLTSADQGFWDKNGVVSVFEPEYVNQLP